MIFSLFLFIGMLTVSILLCLRVTSANALKMQILVTGINALGGIFLIYFIPYGIRSCHHRIEHQDMVLQTLDAGRETVYTGTWRREKGLISIKNSISIYKVVIETDEGCVRLNLWDRKKKEVKEEGTGTLRAAGSYICGVEESL